MSAASRRKDPPEAEPRHISVTMRRPLGKLRVGKSVKCTRVDRAGNRRQNPFQKMLCPTSAIGICPTEKIGDADGLRVK